MNLKCLHMNIFNILVYAKLIEGAQKPPKTKK